MTSKTKFFADHNGQQFTRSTARVYTHTVVSKPRATYEVALAEAKAHKHYDNKWLAYCREASQPTYKYASVVSAADRAEYQRHLEVGLDVINAEVVERMVASVERQNAEGYFEKFQNDGWCGRADLAQKLADSSRKSGRREVTILTAYQK